MAGLIPQHFIDELLNRIDIVDIIDAYVPLKKAGKNHQACCPFHDEKTPSFSVSQQKQFYHCFGCGANGTVISFLMEHLHIGFIDAVEELASRTGMTIPRETTDNRNSGTRLSELYELMELVTKFYAKQLRQHPRAKTVNDYLKGRGISDDIAAAYELGFAPPGWDNLLSEFGKSQAAQKRLHEIGAITEKDNGGYYDRFRNRLIFPIRDQRGRAIGLGGRVLDGTDNTPKYLNSPETPIFHKGRELYGLYQARKSIKQTDCLYIVEGYMDVIALGQYGIGNVVASLGTAATSEHLEKLFRITDKLVFCFDGDEAGRKAAWRAMENARQKLKDGKQVYFMFLPQGEDPDTFVRTNGADSFLNEGLQMPLSEFLLDSLKLGVDLNTPEGRYLMLEKSFPHLFELPVGAYRTILTEEISKLTRYDTALINAELKKRTGRDSGKRIFKRPVNKDKGADKIKWLVRSLLHRPALAKNLGTTDNLAIFASPGLAFLTELIEFIKQRPDVVIGTILENWRGSKFENRLNELAAEEEFFNEIGITDEDFLNNIRLLINENIKQFDIFKQAKSPDELTQEQKAYYRNLQKTE